MNTDAALKMKTTITEELNRHRERNRELKARFAEREVDLYEPRPVDFHFWAWSQRDAAVLSKALYEMGFLIRLLAPAPCEGDTERWTVEAGAKIPLAKALSDDLTEKLVKVAIAEDAAFDGWGTNV